MMHKSIKDFSFDQSRSAELFVIMSTEQGVMALRCLELLTTELQRDPCKYGINGLRIINVHLCYILRVLNIVTAAITVF